MTQTREELQTWAALSDEGWVALQVPRFVAIRPRYVLYAEFLQAVLKQGCARFAPLALIEARAKSVPSFAEKILRKRKSYMHPKGTLSADPLAPHHGPLRRARHRPDLGSGARRVPVHRGGVRHRLGPTARTSASDCVLPSSATARCITSWRSIRRSSTTPASRWPFRRRSWD